MEDIRIQNCKVLIEANNFEKFKLWEEFHGRLKWDTGSGILVTVGHLDNRPVCISLLFHKINDKDVCFWHATSQVVDYNMISLWFEKNFPKEMLHKDAGNFPNVLDYLEN